MYKAYDAHGWKMFLDNQYNMAVWRIYKDRKFVCVIKRNSIGNYWFGNVNNSDLKEEALTIVKLLYSKI